MILVQFFPASWMSVFIRPMNVHDKTSLTQKNGYAIAFKDVSYSHFMFHGMKIYDLWITPEANLRETMIGQTCLVDDLAMIEDPFSFYGKKRTAFFLEELLSLLYGKDFEEAQNFIEVIRNKVVG